MANQTTTDLKVQADMAWKAYERNPTPELHRAYSTAADRAERVAVSELHAERKARGWEA